MADASDIGEFDEEDKGEITLEMEMGYGYKTPEVVEALKQADEDTLNLSNLPIKVLVKDVAKLSNVQFTEIRRKGFGGSDSSMLLGVNPYQTWQDLIASKVRTEATEEEKAVGRLAAVRKGNDLEPLIMQKAGEVLGIRVISPVDMYQFKDFPYLTMNFDGVGVFPKGHKYAFVGKHHGYAPIEIKVATVKGQRYYNPAIAIYSESRLYNLQEPIQEPPVPLNEEQLKLWDIERKATYFGIPKYYYTQAQQEMMALDANHGFIAVLFEVDWHLQIFFIQKDPVVQATLKIQGYKGWEEVEHYKRIKPEDSILK